MNIKNGLYENIFAHKCIILDNIHNKHFYTTKKCLKLTIRLRFYSRDKRTKFKEQK